MFNRDTFIRRMHFSEAELTALRALRTRYHSTRHRFTDRELANLNFMRWLVRCPEWNRALDQPATAVVRR